jgi:protein structure with unknown function
MTGGTSDASSTRPAWPALVRYAGRAELRVVRDQDEWELDPGLHARPFGAEDRLIDSAGLEYGLVFGGCSGSARNSIQPTGRRHSSSEVQSIAERHIESVGAQPEWLAGHLRDIADSHKIRATILYLAKLAAADAAASVGDEE